MSKIIDAVSIVLTCGDEIFAIQRQNFLKAFPGYWAFPGGKVEIEDESFVLNHPLLKGIDARLFGAVVREGREELGIDIGEEIQAGRVEEVNYLGLAVTPDFNPYRFATYFFKIHFKEKVPFVVDRNEAKHAYWTSSAKLLQTYDEGRLLAVPPVIKVIETLGKDPLVKQIKDLNFDYDSSKYVPYIESLKSVRQIMPLSHTLPPATRTNAFLIGDGPSPKILIDPSPKDDIEYEKFKNTLNLFGVDKIMLTHHHPDHHERSVKLAREFKVPMLMSEYTKNRLMQENQSYFDDIEVSLIKEGDTITKWLGQDLIVFEVPGHDEGQLAVAPADSSWFLAGDLFQGVGTVVIGGEEGDMSKYFATLEKVILMNPKVVFPSHGIGLGGVAIIERTLEHRRVRENQILVLHSEGKTEKEMLKIIYAEVPKVLWPYALMNIEKHMIKLKQEGKV
ncbi:MAG TPA: MBL fold metallo-hydrolase [Bacteriovoracaceae bacterium]|nr:MBL fold metallo-hydrolase [Bacteriovoracaceae bacterium]